ncbi:MAG: ribosome small subunit-dependent GTPase A [Firmicutes bacterium]|nr:ribosome small subunit-dependent GTPase A [Bacillota bacterium]
MKKGRIIKLTGGLYTVIDENKNRVQLRPLGIFRHHNEQPKVGDMVMYDQFSILSLLPRENDLVRPAISNVDQALLINAATDPHFSFMLLDKFLALIEAAHIKPVIIVSKIDLLNEVELSDLKEKLNYYQTYFKVIYFSTKTKVGIEEIKEVVKNKVNVLAGQTGAGKSSLLNTIDPSLNLKTDIISKALGRGKHTTRHVELIDFGIGGWIADTPGFSKLEFTSIEATKLTENYPDFFELGKKCKFKGCTHVHEPECQIKKEYSEGKILPERYENYVKLYEEIKAIKSRY